MSKINERSLWEDSIYQLERSDEVQGGESGVSNTQARQLANRTRFLNNRLQMVHDLSLGQSKTYDSLEEAQDAVNRGQELRRYIPVVSLHGAWAERYENINGVVTPTGQTLADNSVYGVMQAQSRLLTDNDTASGIISPTSTWREETMCAYAVGFISSSEFINCVEFWSNNVATVGSYIIKIYSRGVTNEGLPENDGDTLLLNRQYLASEVTQKSAHVTGFQKISFDFEPIYVTDSVVALISITALGNSGEEISIGMGRTPTVPGLKQYEIGYYRYTGETTARPIQAGYRVAVQAFFKNATPERAISRDVDVTTITPAFARPSNSDAWHGDTSGGSSDFWGWALGFPEATGRVNAVSLLHAGLMGCEQLVYFITLRERQWLPANSQFATAPLRSIPSDINIHCGVIDTALIAGSNAEHEVIYPFPEIELPDDYFVAVEVYGLDSSDVAGHLGVGRYGYGSGETVPAEPLRRGYYLRRDTGDTWRTITEGLGGSIAGAVGVWQSSPLRSRVREVADGQSKLASDVRQLSDATMTVKSLTFERLSNSSQWSATTIPDESTFCAWAAPLLNVSGVLNAVSVTLDAIARNATVDLTVYARLRTDNAKVTAPGALAGDRVLYQRHAIPAAELAEDNDFHTVSLPVEPIAVPDDSYLIVSITGRTTDGGAGVLGCGSHNHAGAGDPDPGQSQRGWHIRRNAATTWRTIASTASVAVVASYTARVPVSEGLIQVEARVDALEQGETGSTATAIAKYYPQPKQNGRALDFDGSYVLAYGERINFSGVITLESTTSRLESSEIALKYTEPGKQWPANPNDWLGRKRISNVSVTRKSDGALLTPGTDYNVDAYGGKLRGLKKIADVQVVANYGYTQERYDLIQIDPVSLALSVVKGIERTFDVQEYRPVATSGQVPLYYALVAGNSVELEPVHRYLSIGGDMFGTGDDLILLERQNRRALTNTLAKLERGENIVIVVQGDSISAVANINNPPTEPNGPTRNLQRFLQPAYGADTLANKYPAEDWGDGAGPAHIRIGWGMQLAAYLDERYGITSNLLNFAMSGTDSNSGAGSQRMNAILGVNGDLLILCFGMNDNGTTPLYANMRSIIDRARAAGMDVVVMPIPRTPTTEDGRYPLAVWREMNRQVYQAAIDGGAAYVPTNWLTEEFGRGGMGLALTSLCGADLRNHPGGAEMAVYSRALINIFK